MAAMLDMSQNAYSRMELGMSKLQLDRILKIADILETSLVSLLNLEVQQVVNIRSNQTVNGDVSNQGMDERERILFKKLLEEKDARIEQLLEEVRFLKGLMKNG